MDSKQLKDLKLITRENKISTKYKHILKNNPHVCNELKKQFPFVESNDWYQLLFCAANDIKTQPTCLHCNVPIKFSHGKKHFANYCRECVQKAPEVRQKYHKKIIEKYGAKTPIQNPDIKQKIKATHFKKISSKFFYRN